MPPEPGSLPGPVFASVHTESEDVERAIGERWLLYAGVIVLLLAVTFFLRYAFDRNWLSPVVRVVLGGVVGAAMGVGGRRLAARGYRSYGLIVAGSGIAALYLSTYAALNFYELIPAPAAFALLVVISVAAAWVADRDDAPALAVVAVLGGFATPFLVGSGQDAQLTLFTYVALLIGATAFLSLRRDWWYLDLLSFGLTMVTVAVWFGTYYTPAKAIRTDLFLALYCAIFLFILHASLRWGSGAARDAVRLLLLAPVAYHVVSIAILATHREAYFTYLILATTVTLIVGDRAGGAVLRAIAWAAVALPLAVWLEQHNRGPLTSAIVCIAAIYLAHLAALLHAMRREVPPHGADVAVVHANGIGLYAGLLILLEPNHSNLLAGLAAGLALWHGTIAIALRRWQPVLSLHVTAVAGTLAAIAIAQQFDGPWVVVMWAVEAALVIAIAIRTSQAWFHGAGWVLMAIAALRWTAPDVQDTAVSALPVLNPRTLSAALMIALLYLLAWLESRQSAGTTRVQQIERAAALLGASALTVAVISREIAEYWAIRELRGEVVDVARQAMLSAAWAIYAAVAIAVGIRRSYAPIRYFAIALFGVTLLKVFAVDLQTLAGIYRIAAFFIVGVVLLFASFLYQRRRGTA